MKTDIEIAQAAPIKPIAEIAQQAEVNPSYLECYGKYKAKIDFRFLEETKRENGKLILVTAISPTPAGEGKTTVTIGLADGLCEIGKKAVLAIREPSLGPVFGMKGGATGGGYAQVVPMEDINLHFTGDFHAVTSANNLLAAMIDNHIFQGNELGLDVSRIAWKRCVDMNDRQLRHIVCGIGGRMFGVPREDGFDITAASEVMAILCMARDMEDLKRRLSRIVVGYTKENRLVFAGDLKAQGAMAMLLKEAMKPNLVQTLAHTPALVHGGPFANIAHGCNSVMATRAGLKLGDYCVTEAGFGADLGAEKFLDIKCRELGISPSAVVVVATIRALKHHGGAANGKAYGAEGLERLTSGMPNLLQHVENIQEVYRLPVIVAINQFETDTSQEIAHIMEDCAAIGVKAVPIRAHALGARGATELAREVVALCEQKTPFRYCYDLDLPVREKISAIVNRIYHGDWVSFSAAAEKQIAQMEKSGFGRLPVCIAKTQYSFSDDPAKLCAPRNFEIHVKNVRLSAGAGFLVVLTGDMMTMPGLPKTPAAERMDVDARGALSGLF